MAIAALLPLIAEFISDPQELCDLARVSRGASAQLAFEVTPSFRLVDKWKINWYVSPEPLKRENSVGLTNFVQ